MPAVEDRRRLAARKPILQVSGFSCRPLWRESGGARWLPATGFLHVRRATLIGRSGKVPWAGFPPCCKAATAGASPSPRQQFSANNIRTFLRVFLICRSCSPWRSCAAGGRRSAASRPVRQAAQLPDGEEGRKSSALIAGYDAVNHGVELLTPDGEGERGH